MKGTMVTSDFAGKTALITGAGRGIGRGIALGLADAGASVILLARSAGQLAETRDMLLAEGTAAGRIHLVQADLSDEEQRGKAISATLEAHRVDILVNNAATVEPLGPTAAVPAAERRRAFEVNVLAPAALATAAVPGMLAAGWGRIVNISAAIAARPGMLTHINTYAATKAALEAHTINLAAELRGSGVTVNAYRPGAVDTAMQTWVREQDPERVGAALHERFARSFAERTLITPSQSAAVLIGHLSGDDTGAIWDINDTPARP
jgi:NAD(P)-dependent dehydrogenase (short-subunit alcohol dehydrogenase family)